MKSFRVVVVAAGLATAASECQASRCPVAPLASYVSPDDYPADAADKKEQGKARFRLEVGAQGEVRRCPALVSSGSKSSDETTCRIMAERARFRPATDKAGGPCPPP